MVFRGFTAAASLKPPLPFLFLVKGRDVVFRGFTAAASLKLGRLIELAPHEPGFPRLHRRGLIEARPAWQRLRDWL